MTAYKNGLACQESTGKHDDFIWTRISFLRKTYESIMAQRWNVDMQIKMLKKNHSKSSQPYTTSQYSVPNSKWNQLYKTSQFSPHSYSINKHTATHLLCSHFQTF